MGIAFGFGIHEVPTENSVKRLNPDWYLMKRRSERENTRYAASRSPSVALVFVIQALVSELGSGNNQYPQTTENPFARGTQDSGGVDVVALQFL